MSIYIEYCKSFASKANNRKLYRELASNMRHIKNMKNSEKPYKDLVISLGEQLRNKSAMRDELKGLIQKRRKINMGTDSYKVSVTLN